MDPRIPIEVIQLINRTTWTWAKTYAKFAPHWYIVRDKHPDLFNTLAPLIDKYGVRKEFRKSGTFNNYLVIGKYKYWHYQIILNCTLLENN